MALSERAWRVQKRPPQSFLQSVGNLNRVIAAVLYCRGLRTPAAVGAFLHPSFEKGRHDPWKLAGMRPAVTRLLKAREDGESVTVYGDYDADGVCGTTLLVTLLDVIGVASNWYLPDREKEGYGLNMPAIDEMAKRKTTLIIMVDCGSANRAEIAYAAKKGIDVIVLDHHEVTLPLPKAIAIVNPKRPKQAYPFRELSGTGVAYKFAEALHEKLNKKVAFPTAWLKWQLDIVALATVADRMPLIDENRVLVEYGLKVMRKERRIGLRALSSVSGLTKSEYTTTDIGFALAPRINAAGRMDHANGALHLLLAQDEKRAQELARLLDEQNRKRQGLVERIVTDIEKNTLRSWQEKEGMIVASNADWPKGILGLVATRLAERYQVPTFIFQTGTEESVASARSVEGYNLIEGIQRAHHFLKNFGGHARAAGLSVANENKEALLKFLRDDIHSHREPTGGLLIDAELAPKELNARLFIKAMDLEPFGEGNALPLFLIRGALLRQKRVVGNGGKHLQCNFLFVNTPWRGIAFKTAQAYPDGDLPVGARVDVVFEPLVNEWQGETRYELRIVDMRVSENEN